MNFFQSSDYLEVSFNPIMAIKRRARKKRRAGLADSLNKKIPKIAAPRAPTPTQTPYAVPIGRVSLAFARRNIEIAKVTRVKMLGRSLVKPSVYLRPIAQHTSKRPAIIRMIQEVLTDISLPLKARLCFTLVRVFLVRGGMPM